MQRPESGTSRLDSDLEDIRDRVASRQLAVESKPYLYCLSQASRSVSKDHAANRALKGSAPERLNDCNLTINASLLPSDGRPQPLRKRSTNRALAPSRVS